MHPFDNTAPVCCDSIVVSTLHCGCKNPGSNPGHSIFLFQKLIGFCVTFSPFQMFAVMN